MEKFGGVSASRIDGNASEISQVSERRERERKFQCHAQIERKCQ